MAKSLNRKKIPSAELEAKLSKELLQISSVVDNYIRILANRSFTVFKRSISFKIRMASTYAHLSRCDEKVYECYINLIKYYKTVAEIYEENKHIFENTKIIKVLEGLNSVIISRLRLIYEKNINIEENPISTEKRIIIGKSITFFNKNYDLARNEFIIEYVDYVKEQFRNTLITTFDYTTSLEIIENIKEEIEQTYFEKLYPLYVDATKYCIATLNDSSERDETYYYYELINKEQEILSSIIKIQIEVLENEMFLGGCNTSETEIINNILLKLKEGYQFFSKDVKIIINCFNEAEKQNSNNYIDNFTNFAADIKAQLQSEQIFPEQAFEDFKKEFAKKLNLFIKILKNMLKNKLEKELKKYNYNRNIYDIQKQVNENIIMTDEMINVFSKIHENFITNSNNLLQSESYDIIKGIDETIAIKIESLEENKNYFFEECQALIENYKSNKFECSEKDMLLIIDEAFNKIQSEIFSTSFINNIGRDVEKNEIKYVMEKNFDEEFYNKYKQKFIKAMENQQSSIKKKIINFKKENLLYEISTFEEIINYSVSRLRDSADEKVTDYAVLIDNSFNIINHILSKNGIFVLSPKPHELFNSKEHEVLMAEKNEDFNKGEIIKLMNSGYKQDDVVIMRANVIAAK